MTQPESREEEMKPAVVVDEARHASEARHARDRAEAAEAANVQLRARIDALESDRAAGASVVDPALAPTQPAAATVPAPVAVPVPAPVAPVPLAVEAPLPVIEGHPVDCDPVAVAPGGIEQLIQESLAGVTLKGLVLAKGLEVVTVLVGKMRFPGPDGPTWDACYGKVVPPGAFVIVLAKNTLPETTIARATWFVASPGGAPAGRAVQAVPVASLALAAPVAPVQNGPANAYPQASAVTVMTQPTFAQAPAPPPVPGAIAAGTNEVVVLLQRQECERILRSLTGGEPVPHHDHPSIVRQLTAALSR